MHRAALSAEKQDESLSKSSPSLSWQAHNPQFMMGIHGKMHLNSSPLGVLYMDKLQFDRAVDEGKRILRAIHKPAGKRQMFRHFMPRLYSLEARWDQISLLVETDFHMGLAWASALLHFRDHRQGLTASAEERDAALRRALRQVGITPLTHSSFLLLSLSLARCVRCASYRVV